jgi:hypothetical protein
MPVPKLPILAAAALLTACDARIGNDAPLVEANASAEGKAEDGRITVSAPGFNMSIAIPEQLADDARADDDDDLIYPGSRIGGIHVQGRPETAGGDHGGEVELRFTTSDPADRVAAWYRDAARSEHFTISSATREGGGFRLTGTGRDDNDTFTVHLVPAGAGGTEGRLVISDRR